MVSFKQESPGVLLISAENHWAHWSLRKVMEVYPSKDEYVC